MAQLLHNHKMAISYIIQNIYRNFWTTTGDRSRSSLHAKSTLLQLPICMCIWQWQYFIGNVTLCNWQAISGGSPMAIALVAWQWHLYRILHVNSKCRNANGTFFCMAMLFFLNSAFGMLHANYTFLKDLLLSFDYYRGRSAIAIRLECRCQKSRMQLANLKNLIDCHWQPYFFARVVIANNTCCSCQCNTLPMASV